MGKPKTMEEEMVRSKGNQQRLLSEAEIRGIKEEKSELESSLKEAETAGIGTAAETINKGAIKYQIARLDKYLHEMTPGKLTGAQKDALVKREKELEDVLRVGLPSRYEMDHPSKCPGAVRKHMSWMVRCEKPGFVREYKNIQRLLRPGEEKNVEQLRKDGQREG